MAWALRKIEKEKPAAGKTDYWRGFWRSGWDSNPRNLAVQLISSQSRYDHFDTAPYLSQHQHLRKRGELMGRTSKNIKLRIPEKPRKIKGFRSGSYRVATTISSQSRYDHFDTAPYLSQHQHLGKRGELMGRTSKNIKLRIPEKPHKIKGFRSGSYRVATTISSQPRYDHFDTSPDIAVPLFRETGGFCGSCRTTGLLYHKTPGYARAKSKKFLFRAKSAAEGYIRGGEGAAERKHLTKAALCDIIMS